MENNRLPTRIVAPSHPVFDAITSCDTEQLKYQLNRVLKVNIRDNNGQTPLIAAVASGDNELLATVLEYPADLEACDFHGKTALIVAATEGYVAQALKLLQAGAKPDGGNSFGQTPLMFASNRCHSDTMRVLLSGGADPFQKDKHGRTAESLITDRAIFPLAAKRAQRSATKLLKMVSKVAQTPKSKPQSTSSTPIPQLLTEHLNRKKSNEFVGLFLMAIVSMFILSAIRASSDNPWHSLTLATLVAMSTLPLIWPALHLILRSYSPQPEISLSKNMPTTDHIGLDFVQAIVDFGFGDTLAQVKQLQLNGLTTGAWKVIASSLGLGLVIWLWFLMENEFGIGIPAWLLVLAGVALIWWLERKRRRNAIAILHRHMDNIASNLLATFRSAEQEETKPFVLYLRAFETTGYLMVGPFEFEGTLARFISNYMPIVTFGVPGEYLGAGRILSTEQNWQAEVTDLMQRAKVIIMVPSDRPGTLWEAKQLKQLGLLDKTIMVMPPETQLAGEPYTEAWQRAIMTFASISLQLPSHLPRGLLFKLDPHGWLVSHEAFDAGRNLINLQQLYGLRDIGSDTMDGFADFYSDSDGGSDEAYGDGRDYG